MKQSFFIVGTDTCVGKTWVSSAFLSAWGQQGFSTLGLKPVSAGGIELGNEDALMLQSMSTKQLSIEQINPFYLKQPISPNIAAEQEGIDLSVMAIMNRIEPALSLDVDRMLLEGAGGWLCPLNEKESMADLAVACELPIILVIGLKLGCLSHSLLTVESILSRGQNLHGWVAVTLDPTMLVQVENVKYLQQHIPAPLLSVIPWMDTAEGVADYIYKNDAICLLSR